VIDFNEVMAALIEVVAKHSIALVLFVLSIDLKKKLNSSYIVGIIGQSGSNHGWDEGGYEGTCEQYSFFCPWSFNIAKEFRLLHAASD
jgi:hypothetical protein